MDEIIKEWLCNLFNNEIDEVKGSIENERIWANGSLDDEAINCHGENVERYEKYLEILTELSEKAKSGDFQ